jgi:CHAT domain-containing protein
VRCLTSRSEVEEQIDRLRFQWSKFGPANYEERYREQLAASAQQVLQQLYELLLEPLDPLLQSNKLTIIPHGVLHGVPFHALYDGESYALDRWEIAYAPSASVWKACRYRKEPISDRSLIIGLSDPGIAHVQEEVAALGKLIPNATVYKESEASLSCVPMDGDFRYIHFATHAVFRKDNPLFSGLRLADGWLIAHDLYRRRLECSLATLSACRTGLSSVVPGDELLGLVRGFLCAGARAVMVSLWSAHDVATEELMRLCYQKLSEGAGRAAALRYAQQSLRTRYPHPYYWAAFSLVGAR